MGDLDIWPSVTDCFVLRDSPGTTVDNSILEEAPVYAGSKALDELLRTPTNVRC